MNLYERVARAGNSWEMLLDFLEVGDVVGVADEADGAVALLAEPLLEQQGDLAVTSGDDDAHGSPLVDDG